MYVKGKLVRGKASTTTLNGIRKEGKAEEKSKRKSCIYREDIENTYLLFSYFSSSAGSPSLNQYLYHFPVYQFKVIFYPRIKKRESTFLCFCRVLSIF